MSHNLSAFQIKTEGKGLCLDIKSWVIKALESTHITGEGQLTHLQCTCGQHTIIKTKREESNNVTD